MKKFIVNEVVPNQEYTIEPYKEIVREDADPELVKAILNDIKDHSKRISDSADAVMKQLFGATFSWQTLWKNDEEEINKQIPHIKHNSGRYKFPVPDNKIDNDDFSQYFEKMHNKFLRFAEENETETVSLAFVNHKFLNSVFREYFRVDENYGRFVNNVSEVLKFQSRNGIITLFDILCILDYFDLSECSLERTKRNLDKFYWDEDNQLDISINVWSPLDEDDVTEFYIVFNSAPKRMD